ncbi:hypothetical protein C8R46DRAFT_1045717 [Mycena filopes]|nr:hypothetical protein C8R46DRAFT_1045717 [Mycena filopes]
MSLHQAQDDLYVGDQRFPPLPIDSNSWGSSPSGPDQSFGMNMITPGLMSGAPLPHFSPSPQPFAASGSTNIHTGITPLFVDRLARDMELEPAQAKSLHEFVKLGSFGAGLTTADLATRLYALAAHYSDSAAKRRQDAENIPADFPKMWRDLTLRLEGSFSMSKDQEKNIRGIARDIIFESSRTSYTTMHLDLVHSLKKQAVQLGLDNILGVPAREQAFVSEVKNASSSVRNMYRKDIVKSIRPKTWVSLADFTFNVAMKYKLGGAGQDLAQAFTAHVAILRRFAFDHPKLQGSKDPVVPARREDSDDSDVDEETDPRPAKVRKTNGGGKIAGGKDFWGGVDIFFRHEISVRGKNFTAPKYIDQIILDDKKKFATVNPGAPVLEGELEDPVPAVTGAVGSEELGGQGIVAVAGGTGGSLSSLLGHV